MSTTLDEVRRDIENVKNRMRIVRSNQDLDLKRAFQEHWRTLGPATDKLRTLQEKYRNANRQIAEFEALIDEKNHELGLVENEKVRKLLSLMKKINGRSQAVARARLRWSKSKARQIVFVVKGLKNGISELRRLISKDGELFFDKEKELKVAIEKQARYFQQKLDDAVRGPEILDALHDDLARLRERERSLGGDKKMNKLNDKAQELLQLMMGLPPELLKSVADSLK